MSVYRCGWSEVVLVVPWAVGGLEDRWQKAASCGRRSVTCKRLRTNEMDKEERDETHVIRGPLL